jgi:hypothetical protein
MTVYVDSSSTDREQNGYVVMNYLDKDVFSPRTNTFKLTSTTQYPGQLSSTSTISSDGSLVYLPCNPRYDLIGKKSCIAYPAQGGVGSVRLTVTYLREAHGPVTRLGERTIGSNETTGYGLTIPISAYVAGALPSERSLLGQEFSTTKDLRVDVWSDRRGLPLQLDIMFTYEETSAPPATLLTETDQERLSYSESIPRLSVPKRQTVTVAPNLNAAEQLGKEYADALAECRSETPICAKPKAPTG